MIEGESDEYLEPLPLRPSDTDVPSHAVQNLPYRGEKYGVVTLPHRPDGSEQSTMPAGPHDDDIEPPILRHDPFEYMRGARWMNRKLSPQGRTARRLQEELAAFPVLEGREPNTADIDAMAKRVVDYMVPIFRREQLTDMAYDILEEKRQARIAEQRASTRPSFGSARRHDQCAVAFSRQ